MYKVLVVDDEKIGRMGISMLLKQTPYTFDIVEAENGKVALNYVLRHDIDFLLTDIKMPFMDGIQLIEEVVKIKPQVQMVILSGFSDFDYAKKAMKNGVTEYLLKPIDPGEFYSAIDRIVTLYESKRKEIVFKQQQMQLVKDHILYSLVYGARVDQVERQTEFQIPCYQRMMLLEFENNFFGEIDHIEDILSSIISLPYDYVNLNLQQSLILFESDDEDKIKIIAQEIIQTILINYNRKCYIALSKTIIETDHLHKTLAELEDLIDHKYFDTTTQLFLPKYQNKSLNYDEVEQQIKQIEDDLLKKDYSVLKNHTHLLLKNYEGSVDFLKFLLSQPLKMMATSLIHTERQSEIISQIATFYHTSEIIMMEKILIEFIELLEKEDHKDSKLIHKEIESVKKYIYHHFNQDLSVDQLAEYVCFAPSYLSHIFKKETGENLGKFIKRVRMEKAKDLLENSYEKIVNISVAVGYQNVSYFCQTFREYYGISPQKFRSQGDLNEKN